MASSGLLSSDQVRHLLAFLGYGNPAGRFWFIGMEEQGAAVSEDFDLELQWRLSFAQIEDLIPAHGRWVQFKNDEAFDPTKLVRTWSIMSKLVLRLSGSSDWQSQAAVRDFQAEHLGRTDGETFLTELLPLPAPSLAHWPYAAYFPARADYVSQVLPGRLNELRALFDLHYPELVVCYGKGYWDLHKQLFKPAEFAPKLDRRVEIATLEHVKK